MNYPQLLSLAAPETILTLGAFLLLAVDLASPRDWSARLRFRIGGLLACAGCATAMIWIVMHPCHINAFGGLLVVDPLTQLVKLVLLVLVLFAVLISIESTFTLHPGEYLALILLATVGLMFLVSAEDVLMIFVSLELTSLCLYVLTAFNKCSAKSAEAALKYFLFGGVSAAFMLFGLSLLYGLSGATNLRAIAAGLAGREGDPLLSVALVMTVLGFGFKVAAVPFHLWAPDAYEGAPTPSAALIASGSKLAVFFVFAKVLTLGFAGAEGSGAWHHFARGWTPVIALLAGLSMILGNLVAIVQSGVKRLLAYSAIAHAGCMLLAVMCHSGQSLASLVFYAATYGLTMLGAFGVVVVVESVAGDDKLCSFAGLSRRAPGASFCMLVFMLSLAGIPPLAGFFGKFYVFVAVLKTGAPGLGLFWLVALALAMSAVSFYYYLQVLKQIYAADSPPNAPSIRIPLLLRISLFLLAAGVILLGIAPDLLLGAIERALAAAGMEHA